MSVWLPLASFLEREGVCLSLKCEKNALLAKKKSVLCKDLFKSLIFAHYQRVFCVLT